MPNTHDDAPDALVVGIAQIIDHPSVYMGGPSRNSLRIAKMIVKEFGSDLCASGQQEAVTAARAEIERLTKERDLSKELLRSCIQGNNVLRKKAQKAIAERDEARASLAAVRNEAVDWLAARLVDWWGKSNFESNEFLAEFIPAAKANIPDAQAALDRMLADAERDMRQRAADACSGVEVARWDKWKDGASMLDQGASDGAGECVNAILALPLKHADQGDQK